MWIKLREYINRKFMLRIKGVKDESEQEMLKKVRMNVQELEKKYYNFCKILK